MKDERKGRKKERRYSIETMIKKERERMGFMRISLSICLRIAEMFVGLFLLRVCQIYEYPNVATVSHGFGSSKARWEVLKIGSCLKPNCH